MFGYDLGVIAAAVASPNFMAKFNPTADETGAVVSVFTGGAFFGAMFAGPGGDYLGWPIDHGKNEEGLRTLAKLHTHGDESDAWVRAEYDQIRDMIAFEHEDEAKSYIELFTNRSSFRRLLLATAIQASVQMTGVSAIQYYSPIIFAQIGISTNNTIKYQGISSVLALLAQLSDRRWAMIGGNLVNCLMLIIATIMLAVYPPGVANNASASWGFIVVTWLYNISFSATNGPLSWIVPAEIFDTRTRSKGVSIGVMVSFAFNTMIGQVTPIAMQRLGWKFYLLFVVCNFTNAIYFWATQPETKQRPLEEMNYLFTNAPWVLLMVSETQENFVDFFARLFVPTMNMKDFETHDLEHRVEEAQRKGAVERREDQ
nr:hypothetical protein B0A51_07928 [Rachicladosporium sp. CCFEE 5018]